MIESHDLFKDVKLRIERQVFVALPANYIYEFFEGGVVEDCELAFELQVVCRDIMIFFVNFFCLVSLL